MDKEKQILFPFTPLKGRKITAVFDEPMVSSAGGLILLREALIETGIIRSLWGNCVLKRSVAPEKAAHEQKLRRSTPESA